MPSGALAAQNRASRIDKVSRFLLIQNKATAKSNKRTAVEGDRCEGMCANFRQEMFELLPTDCRRYDSFAPLCDGCNGFE